MLSVTRPPLQTRRARPFNIIWRLKWQLLFFCPSTIHVLYVRCTVGEECGRNPRQNPFGDAFFFFLKQTLQKWRVYLNKLVPVSNRSLHETWKPASCFFFTNSCCAAEARSNSQNFIEIWVHLSGWISGKCVDAATGWRREKTSMKSWSNTIHETTYWLVAKFSNWCLSCGQSMPRVFSF